MTGSFILFLALSGARTPTVHIKQEFESKPACEQAYVELTKPGLGIYSTYKSEHQCVAKGEAVDEAN